MHLKLLQYTHFFKLFFLPVLSDSCSLSLPFSLSTFEYSCLCLLNDLLSCGEVSQDWPSSMHDHMSTPFNFSLSGRQRTAVQAYSLILTKHFYGLQNHSKYIFMFLVNLGWTGGEVVAGSGGSWGLQCHCVQWRNYIDFRHCNTFYWSLEVICDPFALRVVVLNALSLMQSQ